MKAIITFIDESIEEIDATGWGGDPIVPHTFQYDTNHAISEYDDGDAMTHIVPLDKIKTITIVGGVGGY